jgi:molybdenum cofactor cytidylyltransferase
MLRFSFWRQTGRVTQATTLGVILAAGLGSRFSGPTHKLLAPFRGRRVVDWAVMHADAAGFDELLIVTAIAPDLNLLESAPLPCHTALLFVTNPDAHLGQATSLRLALAIAANRGHSAVVVGLGDQPLIPASAWRAVGAATATPIAVATYDGKRRNPVRLAREVWPLVPSDGDEGARSILRLRPELISEVASEGNPADIDTAEDLERWNSTTNL